jgi:PAS domain S-box-containing protein
LIGAIDWSETPLGPSDSWPENLRQALRAVLEAPEPRFLWWGESRFTFYNDAALAFLGAAHPQALGQPAEQARFGDGAKIPFNGKTDQDAEPLALTVHRRGFAEEIYFTVSHRAVAGGVVGAMNEVTERVLNQRRMRILRRLAGAEARTADEACRAAAQIVEEQARDFSFALIYRINAGEKQARLIRRVGIAASDPHAPALIDLEHPSDCPWPLARVLQGKTEKIFGLDRAANLPGGFWPELACAALLMPLAGAERLAGFMIVGASPRLALDASYADFLELFAAALAGALAHARGREQSRTQSEAAALLEQLKNREAERTREAHPVGRLYRLSAQLLRPASLHDALTQILDASIELLGADMGNVQIYDQARGELRIFAQRGFSAEFLTHFESVTADDGSACGMALAAREAVLIEDTERDETFRPHRATATKAGYRAVFSVPLISRRGDVLGVLSTHWREPRRPEEREVRMLELYAGHAVDAIERIRAEEAQRESEIDRQKFVSLVENCTDFIGMAAPDGRVLYINPAGRDLVGLDSEAAMSKARVVDYLDADMQRYYEGEILDKVRSSGQWEGEIAFKHIKTGAAVPVYLVVFQIRYPNEDGALCLATVARDISRRKQSEMMLRASEERFRIATRAGKVGVWEWDIVHNRISWSESLYAVHGVRPETFNATLEAFAALIHPEDSPRVSEQIARCLETGEPYEIEFRVIRPNGQIVWIFTDGTVIREGGRPVRMIGATVDITEHKRLEEALRQSERKLRDHAQQLEQQLIASGRLISLGEVTASMAHEFNNPLGIIIGFVEDLLGGKKPGDAEFHALNIIEQESKRCKKIVQDLMEYARPKNAEMAPTQVANVVSRCIHLLETHFYKQKVEAVAKVDPALPRIHADAQQLTQVLVNLFLNAIDAMPGGGTITVAAELDAEGRPPALVLSVADNGIGIEKDSLPKIFQPFYTAKKRRGLGLGLPICERIITNHGGRIEVKSRPGEGTTFTVYLPLEQPAQA